MQLDDDNEKKNVFWLELKSYHLYNVSGLFDCIVLKNVIQRMILIVLWQLQDNSELSKQIFKIVVLLFSISTFKMEQNEHHFGVYFIFIILGLNWNLIQINIDRNSTE